MAPAASAAGFSTLAGTGNACATTTSSCNDGSATTAQLNGPRGVGVAPGGLMYVADTGDHKVRLLTPAPPSNPPPPPPPAPPVATISSPANAGTFTLNQAVALNFDCREGAGGPGLQSCAACETHPGLLTPSTCTTSGPEFATTVRLNTSTLGLHTYAVTALSRDGQEGTVALQYTVQRFRPLVYAPPALLALATQPCVMYLCRSNPAPHINWENSLGGLATRWCAIYGCTNGMNLLPVNGFDDNLFPFNPDWAYFVRTGHPPDPGPECDEFPNTRPSDWGAGGSIFGMSVPLPCTTQQVTTDEAGRHVSAYFCDMGREPPGYFHGHANWEPATYEGKLEWFEHSSPGSDDDYSLDLHPFNRDGVTAANNGGNAIHIEFDSDETIDHFDSSLWWHGFHDVVDQSEIAAAPRRVREGPHSLIDGDLAEVTGMVGIDAAHTPAAELHPVYAIAIQTDRKAAFDGGTDKWAIFARNWGDEGYCSSHDHPIPAGPITVRIPWLNGARGVSLAAQPRPATGVKNLGSFFDSMNIGHPAITERVLPGEGVLLTFDLSTNPYDEPEYWGTIDLQWTFAPQRFPVAGLPAGSPGNRAPTPAAHLPSVGDMDVEGAIDALFRRLPRNVRKAALAHIPPVGVTHRAKRVRLVMGPSPIVPLVKPGALFPSTPTDQAILKRGKAQLRALCRAYRNRLPGFPGACAAAMLR